MRRFALLAFLGSVALVPGPARADVVHLKNGNTIEGRVISEGGGTVVIEMGGGVIRLAAGEVLYIERKPLTRDPAAELRALVEAGRAGEALARLKKGEHDLPAGQVPKFRLQVIRKEAWRLEKALRFAEAHRLLVEAKALAPGEADVAASERRIRGKLEKLSDLVGRARLSARGGELAEAEALFEKALALVPESRALIGADVARVRERLGDEALSRSEAASAELYRKAIDADPSRAEDLRERYVHARLLPILKQLRTGELEEAKRRLDELVDYAPSDPQARYVYGRLFETKRNWKDARRQFSAALPEGQRPWTPPPTTRRSVAALRKRVETHLAGMHEHALSKKRLREERARVEPGPARVLKGRRFTVTHRNAKLAREVLEVAERQVEELLAAAGEAARSLWKEPCPIYLHRDEQSFLVSTGQPQWSGGLSHTEVVDGKLSRQYLTIYQTSPRLLVTTVPHEVTHLVFSGLTGYASGVPLAVHEGLAVFREPAFPASRERRDRGKLAWKRLTGELIPLADLFAMRDVGVDPTLFYAQSASVVKFLLKKKDMRTFVRFANDVARRGVEKALPAHYGFADVEALEREWVAALGK